MKLPSSYLPKLFSLGHYTRKDVFADLLAGVAVGLVALPLAMAFAIASGVTPQAGLYTAIAGGAIVAIFGGSRFQIAGPTGAFVVIVAGIVAKHGVSGLLVVTAMAGVILLFLGLTGLGNAIKFIPRPIVIGFTNGIALLIVSTQIKDLLGLRYAGSPSEFFERAHAIAAHIGTVDPSTAAVGAGSLAIFLLVSRFAPRVPAAIVTVAIAAVATSALHLPIDTIGSRFRRNPERSSADRLAADPSRALLAVASVRDNRRGPGRARKPAVRRRSGFDHRRPAQLERRTDGARRSESVRSARGRDTGDGRHRAHRYEYPFRREEPGRCADPFADPARHRDALRAARVVDPACVAGGSLARRRLPHRRVARDRDDLPFGPDRSRRLVRDLRIDRLCGSDDRRRRRSGARRTAVYLPRHPDDHRLDRLDRGDRRGSRARPSGQDDPTVRRRPAHSRS